MSASQAAGMPLVVAIDGPSGSGKSSVSRAVATALDAAYLDTDAMYRALTWWCLAQGTEFQSAVDGNTVNMDIERAAFAENAIQMTVTFMMHSLVAWRHIADSKSRAGCGTSKGTLLIIGRGPSRSRS